MFKSNPEVKPSGHSSYSYSHLDKGKDYHDRFESVPGRKLIWDLEKTFIKDFLDKFGCFDNALDFAGGTGRIAKEFKASSKNQYIIDVSSEMLSVAKKTIPTAVIVNKDFREDDELPDDYYDLVTAFRFFPNADVDLRKEAMEFIAKKTKPGGWVICNNHMNFLSIPYVIKRVFGRGGRYGMSSSEMIGLAKDSGLYVHGVVSMGVFSFSKRKLVFPRLESLLLKTTGSYHKKGCNVVYVFKKPEATNY